MSMFLVLAFPICIMYSIAEFATDNTSLGARFIILAIQCVAYFIIVQMQKNTELTLNNTEQTLKDTRRVLDDTKRLRRRLIKQHTRQYSKIKGE